MPTRYRVIKVKGVEPEVFIIVGIDFDAHSTIDVCINNAIV
jgi:hypothetical protein